MVDTRAISKALAYWLRHRPDEAGLKLDESGWASIDAVAAALAHAGKTDRREDLVESVTENDKNRFEISPDGTRIRARQGHSLPIDLDWPLADPPEFLFHGTVERFLGPILAEGLKPMARHHVHLSPDAETAATVGARRGRPVILRIAAGRMAAGGHAFRLSSNRVWLTDRVPPAFIERT